MIEKKKTTRLWSCLSLSAEKFIISIWSYIFLSVISGATGIVDI